ncbi:CopG family ribbon-helix-helix protein [Atopomonas sediminilitoris]|uniref:CopG family ribbon-helix-helix protein n=1 Tax=Atopomonas sediminilitoris TaxID=2919919 RepID=UPI002342F732|nr:ribbon-helix-helix domain-containing protein [Atopomonas sediminilitoris]
MDSIVFFSASVLKGNTFSCSRGVATSIKIDDDMKSRIQHLAGLRQRSSHWIMREVITQYLVLEEA